MIGSITTARRDRSAQVGDQLSAAAPGALALNCFALAADIRPLDIQASPTTCPPTVSPVKIETPEGKAEYVARQREFARRAAALRVRLLRVCDELMGSEAAARNREAVAPFNHR